MSKVWEMEEGQGVIGETMSNSFCWSEEVSVLFLYLLD